MYWRPLHGAACPPYFVWSVTHIPLLSSLFPLISNMFSHGCICGHCLHRDNLLIWMFWFRCTLLWTLRYIRLTPISCVRDLLQVMRASAVTVDQRNSSVSCFGMVEKGLVQIHSWTFLNYSLLKGPDPLTGAGSSASLSWSFLSLLNTVVYKCNTENVNACKVSHLSPHASREPQ